MTVLAIIAFATWSSAAHAQSPIDEQRCAVLTYPAPDGCTPTQQTTYPAPANYIGWAYLSGARTICPFVGPCVRSTTQSVRGYSWTGSRWVAADLPTGWVYIYPFSGSWRWGWTAASGWVAVYNQTFELRDMRRPLQY